MTNPLTTVSAETSASRFLLQGYVQGIGVRPAIARLAVQLDLRGNVANQTDGVEIQVEGDSADVNSFADRLPFELPSAAVVDQIVQSRIAVTGRPQFRIERGITQAGLATRVPRDLAVCEDCLSEVANTDDRRAGYAFTSCTDCGPRYSMIHKLPYERADTSMRRFKQCDECKAEYEAPFDRRFHAQTNACPFCGPSTWTTTNDGEVTHHGEAAIQCAATVLRQGGIVAIKGLGGYQLMCDATCENAVQRLRRRKQRDSKPLAVMLDGRRLSGLSAVEREQLTSPRNPIVLVPSSSAGQLASGLAPGLNTVGIMCPTTPLHSLLLNGAERSLVVTSGNIEGEPLAIGNDEALESLRSVADMFLHHDRPIVRPIDDSVVRVIAGRPVSIRAARGVAPLPLAMVGNRHLVAVGGHQKVAIAVCNGHQSVLGPHIGDLGSLSARQRFVEQTQQLTKLYGAEPEAIAHDLHPDYFTTRWAGEQSLPTIAVQHHHAHVVAGMVEHGWLDRTVLGIAFDGTGFGTDGTIWGGEFLLATAGDFHRVASFRPFLLPGGEMAIREPWRIWMALLADACGVDETVAELERYVEPDVLNSMARVLSRRIGPRTSSVGRLFDAVAAIVLKTRESFFEGEPAMRLEAACDPSASGEYELPLDENVEPKQLDWRPMIRQLRDDQKNAATAGSMAMRFHRAIATAVARMVSRFPDYPVVMSGGCFQNRILTELIAERLSLHPQPVGLPGVIPPNDGGLAAGQLAVAQARLQCQASGKVTTCA